MYMYEDDQYGSKCFECEEKQNKLNDVKYWIKYIIDQLYSDDELNELELENFLEELCAVVDTKVPIKAMTIQRAPIAKVEYHPITKPFDMQAWVEWNKNHLKQLVS